MPFPGVRRVEWGESRYLQHGSFATMCIKTKPVSFRWPNRAKCYVIESERPRQNRGFLHALFPTMYHKTNGVTLRRTKVSCRYPIECKSFSRAVLYGRGEPRGNKKGSSAESVGSFRFW